MINFDAVKGENIKRHDPNWHQVPDHSYRIVIIGVSESRKTNALLNSIGHRPDVDKI